MTFKLSVFDTEAASNEGSELHLLVPGTKEPAYNGKKPLLIRTLGPDSDLYTKHIQQRARDERRRQAKGKPMDEVDFEKVKRDACELYAKMTLGWSGIPTDDGKSEMEFTFENAFKLYMKYKDIRVQVGNFIAEQENFIKG